MGGRGGMFRKKVARKKGRRDSADGKTEAECEPSPSISAFITTREKKSGSYGKEHPISSHETHEYDT
jgi:hypothetical protein